MAASGKGASAPRKRFMFDVDFDDARNLGTAPPEPTFSKDELNAARGVARAEGIEAGRAEAMASIERRLTETLQAIGQRLAAESAERVRELQEIERNAVALCAGLMRCLFFEFQRRHGTAEIEALVRDSLRLMADEPRVVLRLADENIDALQERVTAAAAAAGFAGKVVLVGDDQIAPGDCAIEWADGGAERDGDRMWAEIDGAIRRLMTPESAPGHLPGRAAEQSSDGE